MNQPVNRETIRSRATQDKRSTRERSCHARLQHWGRRFVQWLVGGLQRWHLLPSAATELIVGARCVTGPEREVNQDRCYVDRRGGLFVIADGAGAAAVGERASQAVIEVMAERLGAYCHDPTLSLDWIDLEIQQAIRAANYELIELARRRPELSRISTTIVMAVIRGRRMLLASVGNSRAYLLREGTVKQLTEDDTVVQNLISAGALTPREAARHPMRHTLMHQIGTRRLQKEIRVQHHTVRPGDRILFATDGFTDAIAADELPALLDSYTDPRATANTLVEYAIHAGSRDNITCVVVDVAPVA